MAARGRRRLGGAIWLGALLGSPWVTGTPSPPGDQTIRHEVQPTWVLAAGQAELTACTLDDDPEHFLVRIRYALAPRRWVPHDEVEGTMEQKLPRLFASPEGYERLAAEGVLENENARLDFLGREDLGPLAGCIKVRVQPKRHRKWDGILWYHPDVPGTGWAQVTFTIHTVPVLRNLSATTRWADLPAR